MPGTLNDATHAYASNAWQVLPFGVLLLLIALGPLLFPGWWGRHYPKVSFSLAAGMLVYYLGFLPESARQTVAHTGHDYVSFIALIGALFVISGGIHIAVEGEATPMGNVVFLFVGAVLANFLGTTGASMLLIRPWIRMNKHRVTGHHIAFFIFIVSNVGGCLTPIGDPPLFLGYLKGIPFWWVAEHCWPMWATGLGILLAMFYAVDRRNYLKAPARVRDDIARGRFQVEGLGNLGFLALVIGAVLFLQKPPFVREVVMVAAAAGSYFTTRKSIHASNQFDWHPFKEVAVLFVGIFVTMMPALDWLEQNAGGMGRPEPAFFYWGAGTLSSFLDNAPTYMSFLKSIFGAVIDGDTIAAVQQLVQHHSPADLAAASEPARHTFEALQKYHADHLAAGNVNVEEIEVSFLIGNAQYNNYLLALSVGAVFFGANTYIGNGPNFMVKSIADQQKVHAPSFPGLIFKFTLPIMLPMLILVWWLFFRS